MKQCVVSIFSLIQIFKEQNFAVNLFRYTLKFSCVFAVRDGGAMRDRTADLLRAKQALSQLSYSPIVLQSLYRSSFKRSLVGLSGLEPPTSPLSGVRSNHLSYKPIRLMVVSTTRLFNSDDLSS